MTRVVRVQAIKDETDNIRSFDLIDLNKAPLVPFGPGAHIDVHVSPTVVRQYSLCNSPTESNLYRIAVKREEHSRGGSQHLHSNVAAGATLIVGDPRNNFELRSLREPALLLAGGIGITPLLSMAQHLTVAGGDFALHYFTRSPRQTAFRSLLTQGSYVNRVKLHHGLDASATDREIRTALLANDDERSVYICGPRAFMDIAKSDALSLGWTESRIRLEYFGAIPAPPAGDQAFTVRLAKSGLEIEVPVGVSIIDALASQGFHMDVMCQQGACGTCTADVLQGIPDHRDSVQTDAEKAANTQIMCCVSRSKTPLLILDL